MMNKFSCNIINDVLPLYLDDVVSDDTKQMVEEHLTACTECKAKAEQMKRDIEKEIGRKAEEAEKQALISVKNKLRKKRITITVISVIAASIVIISAVFLLNFIRIPLKYDEDRFNVSIRYEYETMCMYLEYTGRMSGYNLIGYMDEPNTKKEKMYIEVYVTPWDMLFKKDDPNKKTEIFCDYYNDSVEIEELRLLSGDIRMMYEASRDYDKMIENSVLLWSNKE